MGASSVFQIELKKALGLENCLAIEYAGMLGLGDNLQQYLMHIVKSKKLTWQGIVGLQLYEKVNLWIQLGRPVVQCGKGEG